MATMNDLTTKIMSVLNPVKTLTGTQPTIYSVAFDYTGQTLTTTNGTKFVANTFQDIIKFFQAELNYLQTAAAKLGYTFKYRLDTVGSGMAVVSYQMDGVISGVQHSMRVIGNMFGSPFNGLVMSSDVQVNVTILPTLPIVRPVPINQGALV